MDFICIFRGQKAYEAEHESSMYVEVETLSLSNFCVYFASYIYYLGLSWYRALLVLANYSSDI
jgi:hypothetical protein